jgi:uncharacterized protein YdhG (YjbR/CyaY superfamily)
MKNNISSIDGYIRTFPEEIREILQQIRMTIRQAAPEAKESISYGMPAFKINGKPLVYFAAFKNHIGFYATPNGHSEFARELSKYKHGKGSVQFPLDKSIPLELIKRITQFRASENQGMKTDDHKIH